VKEDAMRKRRSALLGGLALAAALAPRPALCEEGFDLRSRAFSAQGDIPSRYTCEGEDLSPPLSWSAPPQGTRSFALIVSDPDAPDPSAPKTTWIHWVVYDLPGELRALAEGAGAGALPAGARSGANDWKREGWGGPCPPIGRHRYVFTLYALDASLGDLGAPTRAALLRAIQGHELGRAELIGTYARRGR
jgi:Raf kinase inhibitor-like YbhB/YbcL family protein